MKKLILMCGLFFVAINCLFSGEVITQVIDGDTFLIKNNINNAVQRYRLYGVDAPELDQEFGQTSKQYLENILKKNKIFLQVINKDKYGRQVVLVYLILSDNMLFCVNTQMVLDGMAFYSPQTKPVSNDLKFMQEIAKKYRKGIWRSSNIIEPWNFRKQKENKK
jgi:micrococcal nuclease